MIMIHGSKPRADGELGGSLLVSQKPYFLKYLRHRRTQPQRRMIVMSWKSCCTTNPVFSVNCVQLSVTLVRMKQTLLSQLVTGLSFFVNNVAGSISAKSEIISLYLLLQ